MLKTQANGAARRWGVCAMALLSLAAGPTSAPSDDARVNRLIDQLSSADSEVRELGASAVEELPLADLPLLELKFAAHDLSPQANVALNGVMPRIRQRVKIAAVTKRNDEQRAPFYIAQAIDSYDRGNHTDAKWDDAARAFLRTTNARFGLDGQDGAANRAVAVRQMRAVLGLGCTDPTVLACAGLLTSDTGGKAMTVAMLFRRAGRELATAPNLSPLYRLIIDGRELKPFEETSQSERNRRQAEMTRWSSEMPAQFQRLLALPGMSPTVAVSMAAHCVDHVSDCKLPLKPVFDGVIDPMLAKYPEDLSAIELKGRALTLYAWEARGVAYSNKVTPQGWIDFAARLEQAKTILTDVWHKDHDNADAATDMLTVALGLQFDRPTLDLWYHRALDAAPDRYPVVSQVLLCLEPKWSGSAEEMIRFGREVVADGNFHSDNPTILVEAHRRLADNYATDADAYWLGAGVWDDVRSAFGGYIAREKNATGFRNALAGYAVRCHQWKAANDLFTALGDKADFTYLPKASAAGLDEARQQAAELADQPDAQGR